LYPAKAKNCWGKCFCTLQKHKFVKENTSVGYKNINLFVGAMFVSLKKALQLLFIVSYKLNNNFILFTSFENGCGG